MDFEELLNSDLRIHADGEKTFSVDQNVARYLYRVISADQKTLETGVGMSTVIFALRGSKHIVITPSQDQVDRFEAFCRDHFISTESVEFVVDLSDNVLPKMDLPDLDIVLIDGGHGFPVPYIDWRYTAPHLKVGGQMIIDDCQLETGAVLRNFLRCEDAWVEEQNFYGRTSVFRLISPHKLTDASGQRYGRARSKRRQYISEFRKAGHLIWHGKFRILRDGVKKRLNIS